MEAEESTYFQTVAPHIYESVGAFSKYRDYLEAVLDSADSDDIYIHSIRPILSFIGDRANAIIMLVQYGYLWDADILMRSMLEAVLRIVFMSYTTDEERRSRIREFWSDLAEINRLKQSERARTVLERLGSEAYEGLRPLVLSESEEGKLREKWPKKKRRALEQKWSFSEIIRTCDSYARMTSENGELRLTAWSYGLYSHLIHADETGIGVVRDRHRRPSVEKEKLILAHAARLLSDYVSYINLTAMAIVYALGRDSAGIRKLYEASRPLSQELSRLIGDFYDEVRTPQAPDESVE